LLANSSNLFLESNSKSYQTSLGQVRVSQSLAIVTPSLAPHPAQRMSLHEAVENLSKSFGPFLCEALIFRNPLPSNILLHRARSSILFDQRFSWRDSNPCLQTPRFAKTELLVEISCHRVPLVYGEPKSITPEILDRANRIRQ
jgi:hypothetical protein